MKNSHLFWGTLALLLPLISEAALYKWVNENGEVVYSDKPPPRNVETQKIKPPPRPSVNPEAAMQQLRDRANSFEERRQKRGEAEQEQKQAAAQATQKQQRCDKLREKLSFLTINNRVGEKNADGEVSLLNEDQRQQKISKTRALIQKDCK